MPGTVKSPVRRSVNCAVMANMRWLLVALVLGVVFVACGDDTGPWLLDELDSQTGFWVRTPEFEVPQGAEVQDCYFFKVPDLAGAADLMIDRFALGLNVGSHHMNVFRVKTIVMLD